MDRLIVRLEDIEKAQKCLEGVIQKTEMSCSLSATKRIGTEVFFKFENLQRTGSFKIRGAYNKIFNLSDLEKRRGVVASSAGNHAQGVAFSAAQARVKATIVMPVNAPIAKVNATKAYGGEVILHGEIYDDAQAKARELEQEFGYTFVHPFQDPQVIAGQGTIGLELLQAVPDLDSVVIPIGGGGLISGIATAIKNINPKTKIFGVQSRQASGMKHLFEKTVLANEGKITTIADGIAVKNPSPLMYESFIGRLVDEIVEVSDDEIAEAIVFLLERAKTVTEGSGAAAMAAAMNRSLPLGEKTCVFLSGGNIDLNLIAKVIDRGQIKRGRLVELSVIVDDLPGNLSRLTQVLAQNRANILEVHHDRVTQGLYLRETRIDFVLETSSPEHAESIMKALAATGARLARGGNLV